MIIIEPVCSACPVEGVLSIDYENPRLIWRGFFCLKGRKQGGSEIPGLLLQIPDIV